MRDLALIFVLMLAACGQTAAPATTAPTPSASPQTADAKPPAPTARASTAWDHNLIALMPQIDACIAQSPDARQVTYAGARDGGVFVRLSSPQNRLDCSVRGGTAQVSRRDEALNIDGENAAIFVRGPGENPGGECYQAPEDANGALVGWMIDPEGC